MPAVSSSPMNPASLYARSACAEGIGDEGVSIGDLGERDAVRMNFNPEHTQVTSSEHATARISNVRTSRSLDTELSERVADRCPGTMRIRSRVGNLDCADARP